MCSIILSITTNGVVIGANRDEMIDRPWLPPGAYWPALPEVIAGRDVLAGGTWLGMNRHGVVAAVLNRHGSLGPAQGKRSRGELPLIALAQTNAEAAAAAIEASDAGAYRSFNVVVADANGGFFLSGLETGHPVAVRLETGVTMITSGEPNDLSLPRIARHLPLFRRTDPSGWAKLLADNGELATSALNILPAGGFGTVCASLITLPHDGAEAWLFAAGPPDIAAFLPVETPR